MDETGFVALEQEAVAGAEGTAWGMSDFTSDSGLGQVTCYSAFSSESPFVEYSAKAEPSFFAINIPQSPPEQSSLCSVESEEGFAHISEPPRRIVAIPMSPTSTIVKPRRRNTPQRVKAAPGEVVVSTDDMADLKGTTAARSRKMTEEERRIMLHKRRLRNRASAARSREKRSRTLNDLSTDVEELMKKAAILAEQANKAVEEARRLKAKNVLLAKENELLKSELNM